MKPACALTLEDERLPVERLTGFTTRAVEALIHLREAWQNADDGNRPAVERAICELFTARALSRDEDPNFYFAFLVHRLERGQSNRLRTLVDAHLRRVQKPLHRVDPSNHPIWSAYPHDWPACPGCGGPALDGHITCGNVECDEGSRR